MGRKPNKWRKGLSWRKLDAWRTAHGLTQTALAERLEVSLGTIINWKSGATAPSKGKQDRIADLIQDAAATARPADPDHAKAVSHIVAAWVAAQSQTGVPDAGAVNSLTARLLRTMQGRES